MWSAIALLLDGTRPRHQSPRATRGKRLSCESLEDRRMLANDFGGISGIIFADANNNGIIDGTETGIAGVQVRLLQGATQVGGTVNTAADGSYQFTGLTAGTYQVEQLSTQPGLSIAPGASPATVVVTAADAAGTPGTVVDAFDGVSQTIMASGGSSASSTVADAQAIGGNRDLFAESLSATAGVIFSSNGFGGANTLNFAPSPSTRGRYLATWDGDNVVTVDSLATLNATGLGGVDLTDGGTTTAFRMLAGIEEPGQQLIVRVYTDAANFSTATVALPETSGGDVSQEVIVPFSSFVTGAGNGAQFSDVGAIQLEHTATANAADGGLDIFASLGPRFVTRNIANLPDLNLTIAKSVDNATPPLGSNVIFTLRVDNAGPADATGVVVTDLLPVGTTYVSANPSQGTYDQNTGLWQVGSLANGSNATLQITARVNTVGTKTNNASITSVDQPESNTTDNDAAATTTPVAIDLSLTKSVDNSTPSVGSPINFTIAVANAGPNDATGVTVSDPLPAELTFNNSTASQGSYNNGTGIWTVGTVAAGSGATLTIAATPNTATTVINTAQVNSANEVDVDSTPGDGVVGQDDLASVPIVPFVPENPQINVVKSVNNGQAPNSTTGGPTVVVGSTVTFNYVVTNTGNVPLANVSVIDDNGTPTNATDDFFAEFVSGDTNGNTLLDIPETWNYRAQRTATLGTVVNTATARSSNGTALVASSASVSNYTGETPFSKRLFLFSSNLRLS